MTLQPCGDRKELHGAEGTRSTDGASQRLPMALREEEEEEETAEEGSWAPCTDPGHREGDRSGTAAHSITVPLLPQRPCHLPADTQTLQLPTTAPEETQPWCPWGHSAQLVLPAQPHRNHNFFPQEQVTQGRPDLPPSGAAAGRQLRPHMLPLAARFVPQFSLESQRGRTQSTSTSPPPRPCPRTWQRPPRVPARPLLSPASRHCRCCHPRPGTAAAVAPRSALPPDPELPPAAPAEPRLRADSAALLHIRVLSQKPH